MSNPNEDPIALATTTYEKFYWRERAQRLERGIREHRDTAERPELLWYQARADRDLWALLESDDGQ